MHHMEVILVVNGGFRVVRPFYFLSYYKYFVNKHDDYQYYLHFHI